MFQELITNEKRKNILEKKSFENLVLCSSSSILDLPLNGENTLDVSRDGEHILASNNWNLCFINTKKDLYSPLHRKKDQNSQCCCDSYSIKHTSLTSYNDLFIKLKYKKRCTSSLWYSPDNMIFLTSGDTSIDVWDNANREITYSFSNLPSLINCMAISNSNSTSPPIAGGLSCGTISMCDIRFGSATNLCKPSFSAGISVLKFLKNNENQLVAGYDNSSILIWDLRKFNRPLHNISTTHSTKKDSLIWGCSVNTGVGNTGSRALVEKHSIHFDNEEEIWDYIKDHENSPDPKRMMYEKSVNLKIDNEDKINNRGKVKLGGIKLGKKVNEKKKNNFIEGSDKMLLNYMNKKSNEFDEVKEIKDTPTDIKISDVDFNIYVSYKNGFIDCYSSNEFKQIKSIDVNKYLGEFGKSGPSRYLQKMKIQLICKDSFVMFNYMEDVGIVNLKDKSFCKYIRTTNEEIILDQNQEDDHIPSEYLTPCQMAIVSERSHRNRRNQQELISHHNYVTDITTTPTTREIYVSNEKGQLLVLHPEYFIPTIGGVEIHVYKVAEHLIKLGFKVVIFTRNFGNKRRGVRYFHNGIKVYHHWNNTFIPPSSLPSYIDVFPYYRNILIREKVDIIHAHMSSSRYKLEMEIYSTLLGYRFIFTDHSLFSFCDLGPLFLNESVKHYSIFDDHLIAVSNRHKENMVLRSEVDPRKISVIPNGLECKDFQCNTEPLPMDKIVVVYISRLCERKGIDLLVQVIPLVCNKHKNIEFIVGGGGPKLSTLRRMVDAYYLHDRVKILGYVPIHEVNSVLRQGHIFLNTSQTESFCIAVLEAACSGLVVVSTNVGGIPEILPKDMILLSEYDPVAISSKIDEAISLLPKVDTRTYHKRIEKMYSWKQTAERLSLVYYEALSMPRTTLREKFYKLLKYAKGFGIYFPIICVIAYMNWWIYELLFPREEIEFPPNWSEHYSKDENNKKSK